MNCTQLPRQHKVRDIHTEYTLEKNTHGIEQSLKDRLEVRIRQLVSISALGAAFIQKKLVKVILSGNGTKIGKRDRFGSW